MHSIDELKTIMILNCLSDQMLKKILKITSFVKLKAGDYVFRQEDYAKNLWAVNKGRVGLSFEKCSTTHILVTVLTNGMTFGISSMVDLEPRKYIGTTKAITDLELFKWAASDLNEIFYEDFEIGFIVMKRLAKILITRLQIKNAQISESYER
ncbi:MAG: cyclic nucleotide-binding domain-containing protein [Deltaproteobacteria bacterium]|nr:cyclic nucleotide-binding domain-containing protein [Deltaproteobacteria bacterium]